MFNTILLQAAAQPKSGGGMMQIVMLIGIVVIFYFFMIRPQQKRSKEQAKFRNELQKGQKVITIGGLHGKIVEVQDKTVTIEVENQIRLKFEKSAVAMDNSAQISEQPK
ncbi:MAG: preprotein translocase subunit YajC [Bacteroidales bacterium]|jgi:preprotein translocase subunit YajC|nr:preprotein translocase subunit YajC [Bacteroidales bacterium]